MATIIIVDHIAVAGGTSLPLQFFLPLEIDQIVVVRTWSRDIGNDKYDISTIVVPCRIESAA